jgi:hypothetical protein
VDVERATELYARGMSLTEIAEHLGLTSDPIRWHLRRARVGLRPPGRPKVTTYPTRSPLSVAHILTDALARQEAISVRDTVISAPP